MSDFEDIMINYEKRYQLLIKNVFDVVAELELDGTFSYVSPRVYDTFGYKSEELIGVEFYSLIYSEDVKIIQVTLEKAAKTKEAISAEFRIRHKAGYYISVASRGNMLNINNENKFIIVLRDISEEKEADQKLKYSEAKYKNIIENMSSGVAVYEVTNNGDDFVFKDFNLAGERIDAVKKADVLGKKVTEVFPRVKEFGLFEVFQRVWKTGISEHHPISLYQDKRITGWRENYVYKLPTGEIVAIYEDHTKQKQIEQKLKSRKEKYLDLYQNAPNAYFSIGTDKFIKRCNNTAEILLGYSKEELLNMKVFDLYANTTEGLMKARKLFNRFLQGQMIEDIELQMKKKNGELIWISLSVKPILDKEGNVIESRSMVIDITKRKSVEEELKASEEKYRIIVENAQEGIWKIDKDAYTTYVNRRMADMLGYTIEEMLGKHLFYFMDDQSVNIAKKNLERRQKGIKEQHDFEFLRKDGVRIYTLLKTSPLLDTNENYNGAIACVTNITHRKISEQKLKESEKELRNLNEKLEQKVEERTKKLKKSEEKYRSLFDNMLEGFAFCKIITDENNIPVDFLYLEINEAFERLTGLKKEETVGKRVTEVIPGIEDSEPNLFEIYGKVALTGVRTKFDIFFEPLKIWLSISVYSPKKNYFVAVFDNITDRKEKEEELRLHSEIMTNMAEGVYLIRLEDLIIVYANPRSEEMFGYEPGEMIGKYVVIVNAPTDKTPEETKDEIVGILKETGEWHGEVLNIKKDGTPFWCYANVSLFDHPEYGRVIVSVHTDITERKEKEKILSKKEHDLSKRVKELRCLYNISKLAQQLNFSVDRFFNEILMYLPSGWQFPEITCARILYNEQEFKTNNFAETKWCQKADITEYNKIVGFIEVYYVEEMAEADDGPFTKEERDLINAIAELFGLFIEHKKSEENILISERKLKNLLESVPIGISISNSAGEVSEINSHAYKILGYSSKKEYLEKPAISHYYNPSDREKFVKLIEKGFVNDFEVKLKRKDGTSIWSSMTSISQKIGTQTIYIKTIQDITDRKKAEEEILDLARFPAENPNPVLRVSKEFVLYANQAGQDLFKIKVGNRNPHLVRDGINKAFEDNVIQNLEVALNDHLYSLFITPIKGTHYANIYGIDITNWKNSRM